MNTYCKQELKELCVDFKCKKSFQKIEFGIGTSIGRQCDQQTPNMMKQIDSVHKSENENTQLIKYIKCEQFTPEFLYHISNFPIVNRKVFRLESYYVLNILNIC